MAGLYMTDALPHVVMGLVCVVMYKRLGVQNADITFYTSLFYLPSILAPLFLPFLRLVHGSRSGLLLLQMLMSGLLFVISLAVTHENFFFITFVALTALSGLAMLHGVSVNNYYKLSVLPSLLPVLLRLRAPSGRIVMIVSQGLLILFAGVVEVHTRNVPHAWSVALMAFSCFFSLLAVLHFFILPKTAAPIRRFSPKVVGLESWTAVASFFRQKHIAAILCFLLFFRLPEAFLLKIAPLYMLDLSAQGGANLSIQEVGLVLGTIGPLGTFMGFGISAALMQRYSLKRLFIPLTIGFFLQLVVYWAICEFHVDTMRLITPAIFIGEVCKGMGLALYFRFLHCCVSRRHEVMSAALCMAVMALGLCLCSILSGELQVLFGYVKYFRFALLVGVLPMLLSWYILTNDELLLNVENRI